MQITDLLQKKLFLEKYAKMHSIESYTLNYINKYWEIYQGYLKDNAGKDVDYPNHTIKFQ